MATYIIRINERTKTGKNLVALLRSLDEIVKFTSIDQNSGINASIEDVKKGNVYKAKDAEDLINSCLS